MFLDHYLNTIRLALYLYPLVALLLIIPFVWVHRKRGDKVSKRRFFVFSLFIFYLLTAFLLTIMPLPDHDDATSFCAFFKDFATPEWQPFRFAEHIYLTLKAISLSALVHNYELQATFFNFLLLLPLGFFLHYLYRLGPWTVLGCSFGFALFVEVTQLTGIFGIYPCPYRLFQVDDLIVNTAGSMYGYALMPYARFLPRIFEHPLEIPRGRIRWRRVLAFSLDWVLLALLVRITLQPVALRTPGRLIGEWAWVLALFVLIPALAKGQTLGKMFLRLRLADKEGNALPAFRIFIRYFLLLLLPITFNYVFNHWSAKGADRFYYRNIQLLIDGIWLAFLLLPVFLRTDGRGMHDVVAGSWPAEKFGRGEERN